MQPVSDRRFVTALTALLVALAGVALVVVPLVALRDPVQASADGPPVDRTRVLAAAIGLGVLLVLAGVSTAVRLLRTPRRPRD